MSRLSRFVRKKLGKDRPKYPSGVTVGRGSYIGGPSPFRFVGPDSPVTIGQFCSIASETVFLGEAGHRLDTASTFPIDVFLNRKSVEDRTTKGPIVVGNDVWIGMRSTILSGVTIGDGAVIAAGSVVPRDVPPYTIVGGMPARQIRERVDAATAQALQAIAWWNWSDEAIRRHRDDFYLPVTEFILKHYSGAIAAAASAPIAPSSGTSGPST